MHLRDILASKGQQAVHTVAPDATLADVVDRLVEENCGSLVVVQDEAMVGIITERDLLRFLAAKDDTINKATVESRMSTEVITGSPDDRVEAAMGLMTQHRIRHLPILEKEKLVAMISIGDIVKAQHHQATMENHLLKNYIMS